MEHRSYWKVSSLLLLSLLLSSCGFLTPKPEEKVVTVERVIKSKIAVADRPKGLKLERIYWHVVTQDNLDAFVGEFKKKNGSDLVFYAISVRDYENLSLNMADIVRYIEQQKAVIVYYEDAVTEEPKKEEPPAVKKE
jgi:hypothetical protein